MFPKIFVSTLFRRQIYFSLLIFMVILYFSTVHPPNAIFKLQPILQALLQNTTSASISTSNISKHLNIINFEEQTTENITCIKTKHLLHIVQTTICLHDSRDAMSSVINKDLVWEEKLLTPLFGLLIRYPHMSFIDVGANIGSYTLFTAALGRFTLSIECFRPNINRIRKAVYMEKLQNNVILVGNAIYTQPGIYLKMKSDPYNVGSQAIIVDRNVNDSNHDDYIVKTMRFDDILPILKGKNVRDAIMKVDIQWSEVFLCETGKETFDYVNIPIVLMEWDPVPHYRGRMSNVLDFFIGRGYVPTKDVCQVLNKAEAFKSWPGDIYWVKMNLAELC